jgi:glutaredoxin-related protein
MTKRKLYVSEHCSYCPRALKGLKEDIEKGEIEVKVLKTKEEIEEAIANGVIGVPWVTEKNKEGKEERCELAYIEGKLTPLCPSSKKPKG